MRLASRAIASTVRLSSTASAASSAATRAHSGGLHGAVRSFLRNAWVDLILGHADLTIDGATTSEESIEIVLALKRFARGRGADGERLLQALRIAARERASVIAKARGGLLVSNDGEMARYMAALEEAEAAARACSGAAAAASDDVRDKAADKPYFEMPATISLRAISTVAELAVAASEVHALAAESRRDGGGRPSSRDVVLGLDTEFQARVQKQGSSSVSLFQLFAARAGKRVEHGVVYLVDAPALRAEAQSSQAADQELCSVARSLFAPARWIPSVKIDGAPPVVDVLTFGSSDCAAMVSLHAAFRPLFGSPGAAGSARIVNVQALAANDIRGSSIGLSQLCAELLGAPLEKKHRMSDWARRPLTPQQARYAALDAFVLHAVVVALDDEKAALCAARTSECGQMLQQRADLR